MEDLLGLDTPAPANTSKPPSRSTTPNYYPTLQPTPPFSGRSTPSLKPNNGPTRPPPPKGSNATPASDSFANLATFGGAKPSKSLSLQDQQKASQEARLKQAEERASAFDRHFGQANGTQWTAAGSGRSSPLNAVIPPAIQDPQQSIQIPKSGSYPALDKVVVPPKADATSRRNVHQEDDLDDFLRFTSPPSQQTPPPTKPFAGDPGLLNNTATTVDDDDIFGIGGQSEAQKSNQEPTAPATSDQDNDDFLGDLARPVSEFPAKHEIDESVKEHIGRTELPEDRALAELVDMGFPLAKAQEALNETESGSDVQSAVGWLLNQAHENSKSNNSETGRHGAKRRSRDGSQETRESPSDSEAPAWTRKQISKRQTNGRQASRSPINGDNDAAKVAAQIGSNLFRTANSLWKTGTTKLNKAVAELNHEGDSSQPKWMRSGGTEPAHGKARTSTPEVPAKRQTLPSHTKLTPSATGVTDEALMLESGDVRPKPKISARMTTKPSIPPEAAQSLETRVPGNPSLDQDMVRPKFVQQVQANDPRLRTQRRNIDEQGAQAYVSPARRRKPPPKSSSPEPKVSAPSHRRLPLSEEIAGGLQSGPSFRPSQRQSVPVRTQTTKPHVAPRKVPSVAPAALHSYNGAHQAGNAAVKRGDYASASDQYTLALSKVPERHPLRIITLTNRALTNSKTGEPKAAIADADGALEIIGETKGVGETIDMGQEGRKDMYSFWGKASIRKAEALEQLEKWREAGLIWKACVEAGVGGPTSVAGRTRCDRAANPAPKPVTKSATAKPQPKRPAPRAPAMSSSATPQHSESVSRLRAANVEADRLDDEKFRLSDTIDARIDAWRKGKEGNLRALLASLETVLWENAGWKKVGMAELIMSNKVKVVYMKGIAKVHPDKVCLLPRLCIWVCDVRLADMCKVITNSDNRTEDDQCGGLCDLERGLG